MNNLSENRIFLACCSHMTHPSLLPSSCSWMLELLLQPIVGEYVSPVRNKQMWGSFYCLIDLFTVPSEPSFTKKATDFTIQISRSWSYPFYHVCWYLRCCEMPVGVTTACDCIKLLLRFVMASVAIFRSGTLDFRSKACFIWESLLYNITIIGILNNFVDATLIQYMNGALTPICLLNKAFFESDKCPSS